MPSAPAAGMWASRGLEHDEGEGRGGRTRVDVGVRPCRLEPGAVAGRYFDAVFADIERDGAGLDGEQLERSGTVWLAEKPEPQPVALDAVVNAGRKLRTPARQPWRSRTVVVDARARRSTRKRLGLSG
jgi:hypothetical protein